MAAVGQHPSIIGVLAACLEEPLAVVQVGRQWLRVQLKARLQPLRHSGHALCFGPPANVLLHPAPTNQELAHGSLHDQLHTLRLRPQYGLLMQLAEDIASALEHCHAQRPPLVHRDLSARNVLLGQDGRARLADFGLAAAKRRTYLSSDKARRCAWLRMVAQGVPKPRAQEPASCAGSRAPTVLSSPLPHPPNSLVCAGGGARDRRLHGPRSHACRADHRALRCLCLW